METVFPLVFALAMGFGHAFEADHLLAVGTIVTRRTSFLSAARDGLFWGLGHTSTIFIIGALMIVGKLVITEQLFHYFEACVGAMLVVLGIVRLKNVSAAWIGSRAGTGLQLEADAKAHEQLHAHGVSHLHSHSHSLAYGVGAVHGLAGSGTLVLLVMSNITGAAASMLYLLNFGVGSMGGMLLAASAFSLPFSKRISAKLSSNAALRHSLTFASAMLCVGYGAWIMYNNLVG
jgi:hypothetical protein